MDSLVHAFLCPILPTLEEITKAQNVKAYEKDIITHSIPNLFVSYQTQFIIQLLIKTIVKMGKIIFLALIMQITNLVNAQIIQSDYVSFKKGLIGMYAPNFSFSTTVESNGENHEIALALHCSDTYAKFNDGSKLLIKLISDNGQDTIITLIKNNRPVTEKYSCRSTSYGLSETYTTITSYDCPDMEYIAKHIITKVRFEIGNTQTAGSPNYREYEIDKKYQKKFCEDLTKAYNDMWENYKKAKTVSDNFSDGF